MVTPGAATTALWIGLPVAGALALALHRLRGPDGGRPGAWTLTAAALCWVPASVTVLVAAELVVAYAGPVGVGTAATIAWVFAAVFGALAWGASHPWARERVGMLVGFAGLLVLASPLIERLAVPAGASAAGLAGLAPGALALTALAPTAAREWSTKEGRAGWAAPLAIVVLLVPWTVLGGVFGLVELTAGKAAGPAVYRWGVHAEPSENGSAYTVSVPFPNVTNEEGPEPTARELLAELRAGVRVTGGEANLTWRDDGARLAVEADGPVTVRSTHVFYGPVGAREAFDAYRTNRTIERGPDGPANVTVSWTIGFSGGRGHTCSGRGAWQVDLAPGQARAFARVDEDGDVDADPDRPWGIVCA